MVIGCTNETFHLPVKAHMWLLQLSSMLATHGQCDLVSFFFLSIFYWLCYYSFPNLSPFVPPLPCTTSTPAFTTLSSCPWVIHISSLSPLFPIPILTSAHLFYAYQVCFLFPVPFPLIASLPLPTENPPCDVHFSDSVPSLVFSLGYLYLFIYFGLVVDICVCCHFTLHSFDHLFLR